MSRLRVLNLPEDHDFIRQALPPESLTRAPLTGEEARGWNPSPAFTARWMRRHAADFDVVHVHFGFEAVPVERLVSWTKMLRQKEIPMVFTVHDLRNPHQVASETYDEQVSVLTSAATEVVTLTPGAARQIGERFGRQATVIAHPPLIRGGVSQRSGTVGMTLKARAQVVDADAVVMAALRGVEAAREHRPEVSLRVSAHSGSALPVAQAAAGNGRLTISDLQRLPPEDFAASLGALEVAVLPYRFGTHSGWLEACRDVGTRVVAPDCGFYAEQWDEVLSYGNNERDGFDAGSLTEATCRALLAGPLRPAMPQQPRIEASRSAYAAIYDRAVGSAA